MRITLLLIGACLVPVVTGCHKPSDVIGKAETTIKSAALAAIAAKYPDVSSSDLKFSDLSIRERPDFPGKEEVSVEYALTATAKTTTAGKKSTTTTQEIGVEMTLSGKVEAVYKFTSSRSYNAVQ
jgi:hypothetical protein